ncbi:hypothetical protein [Labedaea rhizosphaerae]|uniref:Uncharacterized protein n=1 Tax=Labedaea rhizosphaerae TaxID=598644 RepID=A0A4R6SIQ3_LABRH|nr:hypothetical protein [Labedaea rhizosphaerae]TDQ01266.1 hypothetical protein EV186_1021134 [Labedaea rhizosphaerae]
MDPNEVIATMRSQVTALAESVSAAIEAGSVQRAARHYERADTLRAALVDEFVTLDEWLTNGGFLPTAWTNGRP